MPRNGQDRRVEPTASHSDTHIPQAPLLMLVKILARQAAQACCCEEPTEDSRDRPRLEPAPPKSPDLE